MLDTKDYTAWTPEALLVEEKKLKKRETLASALIGFLVGVIIYGVVKNGIGFVHIVIPLVLIIGIYTNSQKQKDNLKEIQAVISAKSTE